MIKVVIFDADGVLINCKNFAYYLQNDYNISQEITLPFFINVMPDCVLGKKELKVELEPYLKTWGWNKSVDEFVDYWNKVQHKIDDQLVDYIKDLRSKNIICCLATNQTKNRFEYMLDEMGFQYFFDKVYGSAHMGLKKPTLAFYKHIVDDLGFAKKEEVLFWDDDTENIAGAKEFGIHAELYTSFEDFKVKMEHYLSLK